MPASPHVPDLASTIAMHTKRRENSSRACDMCRRLKCKCDNAIPICEKCQRSGNTCSYTGKDARRPVSRQLVNSMSARTQQLEEENGQLESRLRSVTEQNDYFRRILLAYNLLPPEPSPHLVPPSPISSMSPSSSFGTQAIAIPGRSPGQVKAELDPGIIQLSEEVQTKLVVQDAGEDPQAYGPTSPFGDRKFSPSSSATSGDRSHYGCNSCQHRLCLLPGGGVTEVLDPETTGSKHWYLHLPPEGPLTRIEHDTLLDLFFKFFASWCFRSRADFFLRDMFIYLKYSAQYHNTPNPPPPPRTSHYSPMLHNAILAIAMAYADEPHLRDRKAREIFVARAKSYIETDCERPTLSVVQALSLLSAYHSGVGEPSKGFLYFGMSRSMSQALGLSMGPASWTQSRISAEDVHDRIWAFWVTFCMDKCWSLYVGREVGMPIPQNDMPLPRIEAELDNAPWVWNRSKQQPRASYLSTAFREMVKLFQIATKMTQFVYGAGGINHNRVSELSVELDQWLEERPECLAINRPNDGVYPPHVIMANLAFWWFTILLHRPFYRAPPSPASNLSRQRCRSGVEYIIKYYHTWDRLYGLRYIPMCQMAYTAGATSVLAASQLLHAPAQRQHALDEVKECISILNKMSVAWEAAAENANILQDLLNEQMSRPPSPKPSTRTKRFVEAVQSNEVPMMFDLPDISPPSETNVLDTTLTHMTWTNPPIASSEFPQLDQMMGTGHGLNNGETFPTQPDMAFGSVIWSFPFAKSYPTPALAPQPDSHINDATVFPFDNFTFGI